jgi:hypothetical protein
MTGPGMHSFTVFQSPVQQLIVFVSQTGRQVV